MRIIFSITHFYVGERGFVVFGVDQGEGLLFVAAVRLSKTAVILAYCSVVAATIWLSAAWLLAEAAARLSK